MKPERTDQRSDANEAELGIVSADEQLSAPEQPLRYVGRSRGVIHIADEDLISPIGEDWEVDGDL